MTVYTYSEARQHLAEILDKARKEGAVQIRRRDGSTFQITPVEQNTSPLDVGYVDIVLTREDVVHAVRESRALSPSLKH
jgi:antitoxin (DNA-binding transcriptional repressor) of toxin-antitoxin stability system